MGFSLPEEKTLTKWWVKDFIRIFVAWCNRGSVWENGDSSYFAGQTRGGQHPQDNPRAGVGLTWSKMGFPLAARMVCQAPKEERCWGNIFGSQAQTALETRGPGGGRCTRWHLTHVNTVWLPLRKDWNLSSPVGQTSGSGLTTWVQILALLLTNFGQVASPVWVLFFSSVKWVY